MIKLAIETIVRCNPQSRMSQPRIRLFVKVVFNQLLLFDLLLIINFHRFLNVFNQLSPYIIILGFFFWVCDIRHCDIWAQQLVRLLSQLTSNWTCGQAFLSVSYFWLIRTWKSYIYNDHSVQDWTVAHYDVFSGLSARLLQ